MDEPESQFENPDVLKVWAAVTPLARAAAATAAPHTVFLVIIIECGWFCRLLRRFVGRGALL